MIAKKSTSRIKKNSFNIKGKPSLSGIVEVKVFQNKNNKQFNLPVLKKNTTPKLIQDILGNDDIIGLKFKITDVILKDTAGKDVILRNKYERSRPDRSPSASLKGGKA